MSRLMAIAFLAVSVTPANSTPYLRVGLAEHAMREFLRVDRPASVRINHCRRRSPQAVACWLTEYGAHSMVTDDGMPMIGAATFSLVARLSRGRVVVA